MACTGMTLMKLAEKPGKVVSVIHLNLRKLDVDDADATVILKWVSIEEGKGHASMTKHYGKCCASARCDPRGSMFALSALFAFSARHCPDLFVRILGLETP